LIPPIFGYCFSLAHLGEKRFGIERCLASLPQNRLAPFQVKKCEGERS
jgi:hypothetical protein